VTAFTPPTGDTRIYVARARQGIPAHRRTGDGITGCGRSTRTGLIYTAEAATAELAVVWCKACWTPGAGMDRTPGVPEPGRRLKPVPLNSFWRHREIPDKRVQAITVTGTAVVARSWHRYDGSWRRSGRAAVTVDRTLWHERYRPETVDDLAGAR
jgi:hypothetical protein